MTLEELQEENKILKRKLYEANAQRISNAHFTIPELYKFGKDKMLGSVVIIEMSALGGKLKLEPFSICDGLSKYTLNALEADIRRSFEHQVCFHPDGYKQPPEFE